VTADRRGRRPVSWRTVVALVALLGTIAGCSSPPRSATNPKSAPANTTTVPTTNPAPAQSTDGFGPFVSGTTTVSLITAPYTKVVLWYPADPRSAVGHRKYTYDIRDWLPPSVARRVTPGVFTFTTDAYAGIPASRSGPFPLVLFAHGLYSFPDQSTFLTTWLASWGYVVAAPDLPIHDLAAFYEYLGQPRPTAPSDVQVLADAEDLVMHLSAEAANPLAGLVRAGQIGIIGHSQGGIDAMQFAARPEVGTYIPMAAGFLGPHPVLAHIPSLYLAGSADRDILTPWVQAVYATAAPPKRLVVLAGAGHLAFTDLCLVGAGRGGLAALGTQIGGSPPPGSPFTASATNGCGPGYLSPQRGFSEIRSLVLSELRMTLGGG
jgi:dienelactone hydrolase